MEDIVGFRIALSWIDLVVVAGAVSVLMVVAFISGRRESDTSDFFLGKRRVPMIVACLSFVATEVSAVSITANPATGYGENLNYLQFFIGSAAAKVFVAFLFIPMFYKHNCTSIYQFLRERFGPGTQYGGSVFFFITRLLASGVRLYAACAAIAIIFTGNLAPSGNALVVTLVLFTLGTVAFIGFGGIKAVVWTGAYETMVFYGAGLAVAGFALANISGGWSEIWRVAGAAGRLEVFNWGFTAPGADGPLSAFLINLKNPTTFWAGTANAFFIGLAIFGTDQELVQRLLTVETRRSSQKAIIWTIAAALPILVIYLGMGTLFFVYYQQNPAGAPAEAKGVLAHFTSNSLPVGLKGLILSAIILASIDSPLSSLSSSFINDIYRPLIRRKGTEKHYLLASRVCVAAFGLLLASIAFACRGVDNILWFAFQIVSITGGSMLGVFLLGILTRSRGNAGNVLAMTTSSVVIAAYMILGSWYRAQYPQYFPVAWSWLIVIGTFMTMTLGYGLNAVLGQKKSAEAA